MSWWKNFRPDVKVRLGVDYPALRAVNQRIIYASISGFGEDGPYRTRPGFDQVVQGMGGLMSITGLPGQGPVRAGIPLADLSAGLLCAQGILLALFDRERTGEGQWVTTSLLQAQVFMLDFQATRWLDDGEVPRQAGNNHPTNIPTGVFKTADGYINIAASGQMMWERLCHAIGAADLIGNPDFATAKLRSEHREKVNDALSRLLSFHESAHWLKLLNDAGVPSGPINTIDQVFADPQVQHLGMVEEIASPYFDPLRLVGQPFRLSQAESGVKRRPPEHGEHTDEILTSLGYMPAEIAGFRERGVVSETIIHPTRSPYAMSGSILTAIDNSIATLTFHNPERRNSVSLQMWQDAASALERFAEDDAIRVIVLRGSGEKSFASGADISEFDAVRSDASAAAIYDHSLDRFWKALSDQPKPTIAMIRGYCIGGGLNIAAGCDLRFCGEGSKFAVPAAKLGLGYGASTLRRLITLVGPQFALEILLTARHFTATEALQMGLVNRVVPDGELESYVQEIVKTIAQNAPLTMRAAKRVIHELSKDPESQDLAAGEALVRQCFDSEDYREGRVAFREKRKPVFRGR